MTALGSWMYKSEITIKISTHLVHQEAQFAIEVPSERTV